jgi:hypothetical protein
MSKVITIAFLAVTLLFLVNSRHTNAQSIEDFRLSQNNSQPSKQTVYVFYFCGYFSDMCHKLNKDIENFRSQLPNNILFIEVPMIIRPTLNTTPSSPYYLESQLGVFALILKYLNIEKDLRQDIYQIVVPDFMTGKFAKLSDFESQEQFLLDQNISSEKFIAARKSSTVLADIKNAYSLNTIFYIKSVPQFIVTNVNVDINWTNFLYFESTIYRPNEPIELFLNRTLESIARAEANSLIPFDPTSVSRQSANFMWNE